MSARTLSAKSFRPNQLEENPRMFNTSPVKSSGTVKTRLSKITGILFLLSALTFSAFGQVSTNFDLFSLGHVNGQSGWTSLGASGAGCGQPYQHVVHTNAGAHQLGLGFGSQSLRLSNYITSGCFDATYSAPVNEAGESTAVNDGQSSGPRQNRFEAQFSIAVADLVTTAGDDSYISVAPDQGNGARMSYLRFEDRGNGPGNGIHVIFDDFQDVAPFGTSLGDSVNGCGIGDDFTDITIATLDRNQAHTIKFVMFFMEGPRNDVVQIFINGSLIHTGTSWEDYYRYCAEQAPNNQTHTVDSIGFRTGGADGVTHPQNNGRGFLIDGFSSLSGTEYVVDDDGLGSAANCNDSTPAFSTIQSAANAAPAGSTIRVCAGDYPERVSTNKNLNFLGPQAGVDARVARTNVLAEATVGTVAGSFNLPLTSGTAMVDGFRLSNPGATADLTAIYLSGGSNHVIQNNIYQGTRRSTFFASTPGLTFRHNRSHSAYDGFFGSSANVTIEENLFVGGHPSGAVNTTSGSQFSNYRIINNVINGGTGNFAVLFATLDSQVSGNVVTTPGGSAIFIGGGNTNLSISNNSITGGAGTAISVSGGFGYPADAGINITGNDLRNNVRAINVGTGANTTTGIEVHHNRFVGNSTAAITNASTTSVNAENNWWGCNYGPGAGGAGCTGTQNGITGTGTVDASPWLTLTSSASPVNVGVGETSAVQSRLTVNSANVETSGSGTVRNGTPASFVGTRGTVNPASSVTTGGVTGTTFTATTYGTGGVDTTVDNQVVNAFISVSLGCLDVFVPSGIVRPTGAPTEVVPVNTSDLTGRGVYSADFTFTFDPSVVTPAGGSPHYGVSLGSVGLSNGGGRVLTVNNPSAGTLVISVFGSQPMTGSGAVVNVTFNVVGAPGTASALNLVNYRFNEGSPCVSSSNGDITIASGQITGQVLYGNALVGGSPRAVPNVTLSAAGSVNVNALTNTSGNYTLSGMGAGSYTVTPSKSGDVNNAVSGLDSALIAQFVVGIGSLNPQQTIVADVSGNGTVTSFDAAMIARYTVALPGAGSSGEWRFTNPSNTYPNVNTNIVENYTALLMGDVTGNWNTPTSNMRGVRGATTKPVEIAIEQRTASRNSEVTIPVSISDVTGKGVLAYQFEVTYDPAVLTPATNAVDLSGTISNSRTVTVNSDTPGVLKVVIFGAEALRGAGSIVNLKFTAIGEIGTASPLTIETFMLNEGEGFNTQTTDGRVEVVAASDEEASISGRVMTAQGQGVSNARVILTDKAGVSRTIISNGFGLYQFGKVRTGEAYTISVESRARVFTPVTIDVSNNLTNVDIVAEQ